MACVWLPPNTASKRSRQSKLRKHIRPHKQSKQAEQALQASITRKASKSSKARKTHNAGKASKASSTSKASRVTQAKQARQTHKANHAAQAHQSKAGNTCTGFRAGRASKASTTSKAGRTNIPKIARKPRITSIGRKASNAGNARKAMRAGKSGTASESGGDLDEAQRGQLRLPGAFGGMGLRAEALGLCADAALWAAWVAMRIRVPLLAAAIGLGAAGCAGGADAQQARQRLQDAGVRVDNAGTVTYTPTAAAEYGAGPWSADTPIDQLGGLSLQPPSTPESVAQGGLAARLPRRYASRIFRHLEGLTATRLWAAMPRHRQESMLSSGGPGAGSVWLQMPRTAKECFPSGHFRLASLRRLGALSAPVGTTCAIPSRAAEHDEPDLCGHVLDPSLQRPVLCNQGPARMRPHRALAATLAAKLRAGGAEVDLERTVVELAKYDAEGRVTEAILDLYVVFPGAVAPFYIDVTIRCPRAERYAQAWRRPGAAATAAVKQKEARYGPRVITVAMESYGRIAVESVAGLEFLAARAGEGMRDRWAAPRLLPAWKASLEHAVVFAIADIDLLCLGTAAVRVCVCVCVCVCVREREREIERERECACVCVCV